MKDYHISATVTIPFNETEFTEGTLGFYVKAPDFDGAKTLADKVVDALGGDTQIYRIVECDESGEEE